MRISYSNRHFLRWWWWLLALALCLGCARVSSLPGTGREHTSGGGGVDVDVLLDEMAEHQTTTASSFLSALPRQPRLPPKSHLILDIPDEDDLDPPRNHPAKDWTPDRIPRDDIQKSAYNNRDTDLAITTHTTTTTSPTKRPVFMNLYEKPPPFYHLRKLFPPHPIIHTEIEVGGKEYGVLVPANGKAKIRIRPDPREPLYWPAGTALFIGFRFLCYSEATDKEIREWLREYRGEYCSFRFNCNNLVDFMQQRLCGTAMDEDYFVGTKYMKSYPRLAKMILKPLDPKVEYPVREYDPHTAFQQEKKEKKKNILRRWYRWFARLFTGRWKSES